MNELPERDIERGSISAAAVLVGLWLLFVLLSNWLNPSPPHTAEDNAVMWEIMRGDN